MQFPDEMPTWDKTSKEFGEMFEGDFPDMCAEQFLFMSGARTQGSQSARKIGPKSQFGPFAQNDPNNTRNFAFWPEKLKFSVTLAEKVPMWPEFDPNFNLRLCEEKIIIYKQHFILLQIVSKQFNIIFYFSL